MKILLSFALCFLSLTAMATYQPNYWNTNSNPQNGGPGGGSLTNLSQFGATYNAESYGFSTNNLDWQNAAILQSLLNICETNGGGTVQITQPGIYTNKPICAVWPYTTVKLGAGVTLQARGVNQGILFNQFYNWYTNGSVGSIGNTNLYMGYTLSATNVLTVVYTNTSFVRQIPAIDTNLIGAVLIVNNGTNGAGWVFGPQAGWLPGSYIITNIVGNNVYLNNNICTAAATNMSGCIGMAMFRDALYDNCPSTNFGVAQTSFSGYSSTNIAILGPGFIDMGKNLATNTMNGYFTYSLWFRQTEQLYLGGKLQLFNSPIYSTMLEDSKDFIDDDIRISSLRDGLHYCGPINNGVTRHIYGTTGDNSICFITGYSVGYPIDSEPMVGFFNDNCTTWHIDDIDMINSYNPIRFAGSTNCSCSGVWINGVHGSVRAGAATDSQGSSAVEITDDGFYSGMPYTGFHVYNVDSQLLTTNGNNTIFEVFASSSGIYDMDVQNVVVNGTYAGVEISNVTGNGGGGLTSVKINNVVASTTITNIGLNSLVTVGAGYGESDISIKNIKIAASSLPAANTLTNAIYLYLQNVGGLVNLDDLSLVGYDVNIYETTRAPLININDAWISGNGFSYGGVTPAMIYLQGGAANISFANTELWPGASNAGIVNAGSGTATLFGNIWFPGWGFAPSGSYRIDGQIIGSQITDSPLVGDEMLDVNNNNVPLVYNGTSWINLSSILINLTTSSATSGTVTSTTSGAFEDDTYLSSGSTITSLTWALPTTTVIGHKYYLHSKSAVTTLSVTGTSFNDSAVAAITPGQTIGYQAQTAGGVYNRIQ